MENRNANVTDTNMDFDASQLASVSSVTDILYYLFCVLTQIYILVINNLVFNTRTTFAFL